MLSNFFYAYQCNDLYGEGSVSGVRYGGVEAVNMADAKRCLGNSRFGSVKGVKLDARNFRKIRFFEGEIAAQYFLLAQPVRKAIYEGVRTESGLDKAVPGWRELDRDNDCLLR